MKLHILIGLILVAFLVSGCLAPEEINQKIAKTYRGLDSIRYDVQIAITSTYDKPYTAYIINQVQTGTTKVTTGKILVTKELVTQEAAEKEKERAATYVPQWDPTTGQLIMQPIYYSWMYYENGTLKDPNSWAYALDGSVVEAYAVPTYKDVVGESQTITGSSSEIDASVFIEKPDKKTIITSGSHDAFVSGGETIDGTWYNRLEPAGQVPESKEICNDNTMYEIGQMGPEGGYFSEGKYIPPGSSYLTVISDDAAGCNDFIGTSIWQVPAALDDKTKFKVNTSEETIDGVNVIVADVESVTGEPFTFEANTEPLFQKAKIWFDPKDFKLIKFIGTFEKSAKREVSVAGEELGIGSSETYTVTFKNVVFNPTIPSSTFAVDLSEYGAVNQISAQQGKVA
jgi:outer membrane lipoprotein-sorting protein